jgi:hypothetical protein
MADLLLKHSFTNGLVSGMLNKNETKYNKHYYIPLKWLGTG